MKKFIVALALALVASSAQAADRKMEFSVQEAMGLEKVKSTLSGDVSFHWGEGNHPAIAKNFGEFKTSQRTNKLGKEPFEACSWALAAALKQMEGRAFKEGGNAVVNLVSNIKNNTESSPTDFSCLVGGMMVNVAIKGDVVKLAQ